MMPNVNVADKAREMSDGELAATIAAMQGEQARRAAIPADKRPDPQIAKMLRERHDNLYGNHLG